jgi:hypothetical protein
MLATVTFDGFMGTPAWATLELAAFTRFARFGGAHVAVVGTLGLLSVPILFVIIYRLFAGWMALVAGRIRRSLSSLARSCARSFRSRSPTSWRTT